MTYTETLDFLFRSLPVFQQQGADAYKPGLERVEAFCRYLESPDRNFLAIHVAGTNGKGSVSHMLAAVLQAAGYRVGLYTSPHLIDFRERIRIDGAMIPENEVVAFVEHHRERMVGMELSFFEMTVGLAFDWFARQEVEVAVVETGLGGRLDATNILRPLLSVITNIGFDHMSLLGDTIPAIAAEKAGIIKPGVPVVIGEEDPESAPVFRAVAEKRKAPLYFAEAMFRVVPADAGESLPDTGKPVITPVERRTKPSDGRKSDLSPSAADGQSFRVERIDSGESCTLTVDLPGDYQRRNIVTVLAALRILNRLSPLSISRRAIAQGLRDAAAATDLLGRWQVLGRAPLVVADTAHNEHGLRVVAAQIKRQTYKKLWVVLGVVSDKDLASILPLLPTDAYYFFTQASVARALPANQLAAEAARYGLRGEVAPGVAEAYARARKEAADEDMIFVGGSTFTVADLLTVNPPAANRPDCSYG